MDGYSKRITWQSCSSYRKLQILLGIYSSFYSLFYVYAYAFGDCLVNSLYSKYEEGDRSFNDKYYFLLESGGAINYKNHLKNLI